MELLVSTPRLKALPWIGIDPKLTVHLEDVVADSWNRFIDLNLQMDGQTKRAIRSTQSQARKYERLHDV